ncbi:hypothetical protein [Chamaesiphon polymorphus]|nr:hypothetical protein [Chamaesiphon polymorphus]
MNIVKVAGGFFEEAVGGEVFLGLEELARSIEPVDVVCVLGDRS